MLKKLNNWWYGIEQRIEKWGRLQNAYYAGKKAYSKYQVNYGCNPFNANTHFDEYCKWSEGWRKAQRDSIKARCRHSREDEQ